MWFNDYGWPVIAPTRYAANLPEIEMQTDGGFRVLSHGQDVNPVEHTAETLTAGKDFTIDGSVITLNGVEYHGMTAIGYDADQDAFVTTFTAMSADGQTVWGIRAAEQE